MSKRIVIVDESEISRDGYTNALTDAGATVTGAVCHDQIDTLNDKQLRVDIALVNLADPRDHWATDDFPGIGAIKEILRRVERPPLVVGYTSFDDHAGVRLRAYRAGVRLLYNRSDLEDDHVEAPLAQMILRLDHTTPANLTLEPEEDDQRQRLGLPGSGDIEGLTEAAGHLLLRDSMIGEQAQYQERKAFGRTHAVTARTSSGGASDQEWPSWKQIGRIWQWLAKTEDIPERGSRPPAPK